MIEFKDSNEFLNFRMVRKGYVMVRKIEIEVEYEIEVEKEKKICLIF